MKIEYNFENNINKKTCVDIYFPALEFSDKINLKTKKPMILLIYGFRAFKDWGFFPYMAEKITKAGFFCSIIDFSLNNLTDKSNSIFDMENFSKNTITQEITEIQIFLDNLKDEKIDNLTNWNGEIYLVGHSLGGALAIMTAYFDALKKNPIVKKLVTICSIFDFDIYTEKQKKDWIETGIKQFKDSTTQQIFTLDVNFLLDRLQYSGEKSLTSAVSKLEIPFLIIHSEADVTVSPKAATILFNSMKNKELAKLEIIKKANHLLGISHPFKETNPILEQTISEIINFLK
jgi:pimeloyl-ACP methyl ester carboxylesterase